MRHVGRVAQGGRDADAVLLAGDGDLFRHVEHGRRSSSSSVGYGDARAVEHRLVVVDDARRPAVGDRVDLAASDAALQMAGGEVGDVEPLDVLVPGLQQVLARGPGDHEGVEVQDIGGAAAEDGRRGLVEVAVDRDRLDLDRHVGLDLGILGRDLAAPGPAHQLPIHTLRVTGPAAAAGSVPPDANTNPAAASDRSTTHSTCFNGHLPGFGRSRGSRCANVPVSGAR